MASAFLDTNILVYAATARTSDPAKWARALEIISSTEFGTSGQVLAEFVSVVRHKFSAPMPDDELDQWLDRLSERDVVPVDAELVRRGEEVASRYRIGYYDGAVIAAAERLGAGILFTEDLNHGQAYGSVRAVNPFLD